MPPVPVHVIFPRRRGSECRLSPGRNRARPAPQTSSATVSRPFHCAFKPSRVYEQSSCLLPLLSRRQVLDATALYLADRVDSDSRRCGWLKTNRGQSLVDSRARIEDRHHLLPKSAESPRDGLLTIVLIGVTSCFQVLPTLYPSLAHTLPKSCPHFTQVLPTPYPSLAHTLP